MRRELRRIDEDRHDHAIGAALRQAHQSEVALMQRAHGRNERDCFALRTPSAKRVPQRRQAADDAGALL
jgi:hypothetical protein